MKKRIMFLIMSVFMLATAIQASAISPVSDDVLSEYDVSYIHRLMPTKLSMTYTPSSYYRNNIYYSRLVNVNLTGNQRTDIVNVAASQLGYHEGNNNAGMSGTTNGTNNYTEYNYWYYNGSHNGGSTYPWCAVFVSWCARQARIPTSIIKNSAGAGCSQSYFNLTYYNGASYTPKPGDLFFHKDWSHVGIVKSVSGSTFVTIEGNSGSNTTEVTSRTLNKSNFYFGVPKYNTNNTGSDSSFATNFRMKSGAYTNAYSGVNGSKVGRVYPGDVITVKTVYSSGWMQISCPWTGGTNKIVYVKISEFKFNATKYINAYSGVNGTKVGRVYPNDLVTVIEIYSSGWMKCNCPWGNTTKIIYIKTSEIY